MTTDIGLRPGAQILAHLARILRAPIDQLESYRRYVRAGSEIERLLLLSDRHLAERGLKRAEVGRAILEKHGVTLGASQPPSRCSDR